MGYKIVVRHLLDEDPDMKHGENCTDIVYRIDTGYGSYPVIFNTLEGLDHGVGHFRPLSIAG